MGLRKRKIKHTLRLARLHFQQAKDMKSISKLHTHTHISILASLDLCHIHTHAHTHTFPHPIHMSIIRCLSAHNTSSSVPVPSALPPHVCTPEAHTHTCTHTHTHTHLTECPHHPPHTH